MQSEDELTAQDMALILALCTGAMHDVTSGGFKYVYHSKPREDDESGDKYHRALWYRGTRLFYFSHDVGHTDLLNPDIEVFFDDDDDSCLGHINAPNEECAKKLVAIMRKIQEYRDYANEQETVQPAGKVP